MPTFRNLRRSDSWRIHNLSKTYGALPSEVAKLSPQEFHFCEAVFALGIRVDNILNAHYDEKKGQQKPELAVLLTDRGEPVPVIDAATTLGAKQWLDSLIEHKAVAQAQK